MFIEVALKQLKQGFCVTSILAQFNQTGPISKYFISNFKLCSISSLVGMSSDESVCLFGMLTLGKDGCIYIEDLESSMKLNVSLAVMMILM